jgi:acetyl-CoA carboxylase alpha subunit
MKPFKTVKTSQKGRLSMDKKFTPLEFEIPIYQIKDKIEELKSLSSTSGMNLSDQIETLEKQSKEYSEQVYSNLKPSQKLQITRHPMRPNFLDYIENLTEDFIELHGDRKGTDDRAMVGGVCYIQGQPVMLIGTQKGKNTKENLVYTFESRSLGLQKGFETFLSAKNLISDVTLMTPLELIQESKRKKQVRALPSPRT